MSSVFLGSPFKTVVLGMMLFGLCVWGYGVGPAGAQQWDDDKLLMDLQSGGAELFREISPSMIQIFNLDYESWGGGAGSGYIFDKEGHAITNKHVVGNSQIVEIALFGDEDTGVRHKGIVIGEDPQLDLAIVKVIADPSVLKPIRLADSSRVKVGDVVATCGSPGGDAGIIDPGDTSFSSANWLDFFNFNLGVVDEILDFQHSWMFYTMGGGTGREQYGMYYGSGVQYLFHVSAAINHGNSGGPCINAFAEAIGTNTWGGGGENIGYSVPTNFLKRSASDIIQYGRARTPWFGILLHPPDIPYKWASLDSPAGLTNEWDLWFDVVVDGPKEIMYVNSYSPAYEAGIRAGDKLISVDNVKYDNLFDIYKYFLNGRIGQEVTVMIERNGRGLPPITVELAEKKVRFDSVKIDTYSIVDYKRPYTVTLTY